MESLYTRYRPQRFDQVVGQTHVVQTLTRALQEHKTSHAYLFCGPRGTGKTTMARLLAKALICEHAHEGLPDGTCNQCELIARGDHPDVIELDAASRTGVDNVREEIISHVQYAPIMGTHRVFIIDEVHMLTTAASNALLKTLEEPPAHVVFVLCTTDPHKIIPTVLSRLQRFDFHAITAQDMQDHLARVCAQEGWSAEPEALAAIVQSARGGMRDALCTLEQISLFSAQNITHEAVEQVLGSPHASCAYDLVRALAVRSQAEAFSVIGRLVSEGEDVVQFVQTLTQVLRDVYVVKLAPTSTIAQALTAQDTEGLADLAAQFPAAERLEYMLELASGLIVQLKATHQQRLLLEIACIRMCQPEREESVSALASRVAELEAQIARLTTPAQTAGMVVKTPEQLIASSCGKPFRLSDVTSQAEETAPSAVISDSEEPTGHESSSSLHVPVSAAPAAASVSSAHETLVSPTPSASQESSVATTADPAVAQMNAVDTSVSTIASEAGEAVSAASAPQPVDNSLEVPENVTKSTTNTTPVASIQAPSVLSSEELQTRWKQVIAALTKQDPSKGALFYSAEAVACTAEELVVEIPANLVFVHKMLRRPEFKEALRKVVEAGFGVPQVRIEAGDEQTASASRNTAGSTPAVSAPAVSPIASTQTAPAVPTPTLASPFQEHTTATTPASPAPATPAVTPEAAQPPTTAYAAPWEDAIAAESSSTLVSSEEVPPLSAYEDVIAPEQLESPSEPSYEASVPRGEIASSVSVASENKSQEQHEMALEVPATPAVPAVPAETSTPASSESASATESSARTAPKPARKKSSAKAQAEYASLIALLTEAFGEPIVAYAESSDESVQTNE